jgi:glyoxylase-like metal-dependent hydrolase (beta-lactamase superfamily II)/rhodanese-related sulfurtransferase
MYFKQILDERCGCASYIIASTDSREAAVVDPAITLDPYEDVLRERRLCLRYVIDTHIHADHVSGARALVARHTADDAALCLHASARVTYPFRGLADGDELPLGELRLRIVHTPGHRPELISVLFVNPPRSPEPSMVMTGDSLLVGDVGRPDFGGGDAVQQYESMIRLLRLPDWVAVFPGHFEGPCGKGMCGRPSTTIGFERLYNPLLHLARESFVAELTADVPARPLNMVAIEATNRGTLDATWAMLTTQPRVAQTDVAGLADRPAGALVVDVREPSEYVEVHVPGAVSLPQSELASRLDELPRDRDLYLICRSGSRSLHAAQFLHQTGFEHVVNVRGGTEAWISAGQPVARGDQPGDGAHVVPAAAEAADGT